MRAAAIAGAPADVWRADRLPAYLDRLSQVHFGAEWMRPRRAGILPDAGVAQAQNALTEIGIPTLFLHGAQDMTFPASLAVTAADQIAGAHAVVGSLVVAIAAGWPAVSVRTTAQSLSAALGGMAR